MSITPPITTYEDEEDRIEAAKERQLVKNFIDLDELVEFIKEKVDESKIFAFKSPRLRKRVTAKSIELHLTMDTSIVDEIYPNSLPTIINENAIINWKNQIFQREVISKVSSQLTYEIDDLDGTMKPELRILKRRIEEGEKFDEDFFTSVFMISADAEMGMTSLIIARMIIDF